MITNDAKEAERALVMRGAVWSLLFSLLLAALPVSFSACHLGRSAVSAAPGDTPGQSDADRLQEVRRMIEQEIGIPDANNPSQCKLIPLGSKPCGGPASYLIYSSARTDEPRLKQMVAEFNRLQKKVHQDRGLMSDCMVVAEPQAELVDGICRIRRN